jgi:hypothetical protein
MHQEIIFNEKNNYTRIDLRQFPPFIFKDRSRRRDITVFVDGAGRLTIEDNGKRILDIPDWNSEP